MKRLHKYLATQYVPISSLAVFELFSKPYVCYTYHKKAINFNEAVLKNCFFAQPLEVYAYRLWKKFIHGISNICLR